MTRIDSSHATSLAALIRSQIAVLNQEPPAKTKGSAASPGEPADPSATRSAMALRIRALSSDDPQRKRKAFRIFMSAALSQQLGIPDKGPYVDRLVERVVDAMNADPDLAKDIDDAATLLLGGAVPDLNVPLLNRD